MGNYAVFLEPQGELRKTIVSLKNAVNVSLPNQKYCNHPPHCTLIFGAYQKIDNWTDELQAAISSFASFQLDTEGFHVFYYDQPAGGGHTVVIKIARSDPLFSLQTVIGNVLSKHKQILPGKLDTPLVKQEPFKTSLERYGFPFVGVHWLPHFSIASLKIRKNSLFLKSLIRQSVSFSFTVQQLSVWEVEGDRHNQLHTIRLKGA